MRFEQAIYGNTTEQMVLPLFQPLRLWSSRQNANPKRAVAKGVGNGLSVQHGREFSMKGGFMSVAGGERRLVIAGKIFKTGEI